MTAPEKFIKKRHAIQWILAPIVILTIGLGWYYPAIGFIVPVVMLTGFIGGAFNGRYVCGNLCPRGSFFDRYFGWSAGKRRIPSWMKSMTVRWILFVLLMAFMAFNISHDPKSWRHWGHVFWLMCAVTTGLGLLLVAFIHPRAWCSICPMGTMQNAMAGRLQQIRIDPAKCRMCRKCENVCPMNIPITSDKDRGIVTDRDCLKCRECISVCPFDALSVADSSDKTQQS